MRLTQDWKARLFALFFISLIEYAATLALPHVPQDDLYFAACGALNFITLVVLTVTYRTPFMIDFARLIYAQLFLQFVGFVLYQMYLPAQFYNASIHAIVIVTYARIFWIGGEIDDVSANYLDCIGVSRNAFWRSGHTSEA